MANFKRGFHGGLAVWLGVCVPQVRAVQALPEGPDWIYPVQAGDTVVAIAARHLDPAIDWSRLARLNHVGDPRRLRPGTPLRIPLAWLRHDPVVVEVVHLRGDVRRVAGPQATALALGDRLRPGDRVETGPDASATLRFADGSRLLLTPGSSLRVDQAGQHPDSRSLLTRLGVQRGSAETRVEPKADLPRRFEIGTPIANLGVRGTEFRTHAGADTTHLEVLAGRVAVGQALTVDGGFGSVVRAGGPPGAPLRLAAAPDLTGLPERFEQLAFVWPAVPGVAGYRAQVFADGPQGDLLLDSRVTGPAAAWAPLPDGRYQLRVRVIDGQGLEGLDAQRPLRLVSLALPLPSPPLPPPLPEAPAAGPPQPGRQGVAWHWPAVAAAQRYQVQAAHEAGFEQTLLDWTVAGLQVLLPLSEPGRYALRLRGIAADGAAGPYGAVQWVDVAPPPPGARQGPHLAPRALP